MKTIQYGDPHYPKLRNPPGCLGVILILILLALADLANAQTKQPEKWQYYLIGYSTPNRTGSTMYAFKLPPTQTEIKKAMADGRKDTVGLIVIAISPITEYQYNNFLKPIQKR